MNARWVLMGVLVGACVGRPPNVAAPRNPRPIPSVRAVPDIRFDVGESDDRSEAASVALHAGLLPLAPTGIPEFAQLEPNSDGRGVLIAILDSGIDPDADGLSRTSRGTPKLLDLRDLSGEGDVELFPADLAGDTIRLGNRFLLGRSVLQRRSNQEIWVGRVVEVRFGNGPGADLNDNGIVGDTMLVVVARGTTTWVLLADTDNDGTIEDERPVRDFSVAQESFGWAQPGESPPMGIAVSLEQVAGKPQLTLVFDSSGHGTHVAGIAAGHDLYGVSGFDGVAPGAALLGLKISDNANRVTTTGSVLRALVYAIAFAEAERLPLVVNLSFGVGNYPGQIARIDAVIDSILKDHPQVVMTVAATNQGPGLGSLGFPATASEVIAVGATMPRVFEGLPPDRGEPDPLAWYSSRGGSFPGPTLVAPGTAWSVVPRYLAGAEEKSGTSMAAPHVAGLVARLISSAELRGKQVSRAQLTHALTRSSRRLPETSPLEQGAGVPDVGAAARWLAKATTVPTLSVEVQGTAGRSAIWFDAGLPPSRVTVRLWRNDPPNQLSVRIRSTAPWLNIEGGSVKRISRQGLTLSVGVDSAVFTTPGVRVAELLVENADDLEQGVLASIPVTVRVPLRDGPEASGVVAVQAGASGRVVFNADADRGFMVTVTTLTTGGHALVALHEPGGQPYREIPITPAGRGNGAGVVEVDAADVRSGLYEVVVVAPPTSGIAARVVVTMAPVLLDAVASGNTITSRAIGIGTDAADLRLRILQLGVAWSEQLQSTDPTMFSTPFPVPRWATGLVLDVSVPPEVWSRLTDFGVSLRGVGGRLVQEAPLSYPFGRVHLSLPPGLRGDTLTLNLTPAFAEVLPVQEWRAKVTATFEADEPRPVDRGGTTKRLLNPGESRELRIQMINWPLPVPTDWLPVVSVVAELDGGLSWTRQVILSIGQDRPE